MKSEIISVCGNTKYHCIRLHRGEDLLKSIQNLCVDKNIGAGFISSGVGCISKGKNSRCFRSYNSRNQRRL